MLANGSIDGFIMALSAETQLKNDFNHLKEVTEQGIPLVLVDRVTNEVNCDKVIIDDELGAYLATKKLIGQGRKKIALITTDDYLSVSKARTEGYKKALLESGMQVDNERILKLSSMEMDEKRIEAFFQANKVDFVTNSDHAPPLSKLARKVPAQSSIRRRRRNVDW